jgi:hypothetical protein
MTSQLEMTYDARFVDDEHRAKIMDELREVIGSPSCPRKDVVFEADIPKSSLSMALDLTDGHDVPLRVFLYAVRRASNDRLVKLVAGIRDLDVRPRELTASEKLAAASRWFSENPALRKAFEDETGVRL